MLWALSRSLSSGDQRGAERLMGTNVFAAAPARVRERLANLAVSRKISLAVARAVGSLIGTNRCQGDCEAALGC